MLRTLLTGPADGSTAAIVSGRAVIGTRSSSSLVARISSGLLAFAGLGLAIPTATAQAPVGLTEVGPVDPAEGYPQYYGDANGLRLRLCQDPNVCFYELPNPALPAHFPTSPTDPATNYPDEQFYWAANGDMTGPAASALYVSAVEAAFVNGTVEIGQQMVFTRLRIRVTGLVDGATYTITHPYGVQTLVAGVDGPLPGTINITEDVGAGAAGAFGLAQNGNVGPFLVPLGFVNGGPGSFIADGATATQVQGSPLGTNFLRIAGPNAGLLFPGNAIDANTAQSNEFILQGQVATTLGAGIAKAYVAKQGTETAINVWAFAAAGSLLQASADTALPVSMVERAPGQFFGRVLLGAAAAPTAVTVSNLSDFPVTAQTLGGLADLVTASAVYTVGGSLVVTANSSDQVGSPALTLSGDGLAAVPMTSTGNGAAVLTLPIAVGSAPPDSVRIVSAAGGVANAPVAVVLTTAPPVVPVVANAGPDQNVGPGANVAVSGLASTGPIATYAWAQTGGPAVALTGAATANAAFVAPSLPTASSITLTLTVRSAEGAVSSDSVVINVAAVPPPPAQDRVAILDARFIVQRNQWRVSGTATLRQGQTITVYLGTVGNTARVIGTATVGAAGTWSLQTPQGSGPTPVAADTTVWAASSLGGTPGSATFRRN